MDENSQSLAPRVSFVKKESLKEKFFQLFSTTYVSWIIVFILLVGAVAGVYVSLHTTENRQHASGSATFTIDFSQPIAPLHHNATGFVENVSNISLNSSLLKDLHPNLIRTDDPTLFSGTTYANVHTVFPRIQFVLGGGFHYGVKFCQPPTYTQNCKFPGDSNDWSIWDTYITNYINQAKAVGYSGEWDIWGEPDATPGTLFGIGFINDRSETQFYTAWQKAYTLLKTAFPQAIIDGPSLSTLGDATLMKRFLFFAKDTHTLPSNISWHENGPDTSTFARDISFMRNWLTTNGFPQLGIDISEYHGDPQKIHHTGIYHPGALVTFIKDLEENAVLGAAHSCWNPKPTVSDCATGNLDGAIASDGNPTPLWWVYNEYAKMQGTMLTTSSISSLIQALSVYDPTTQTVHMLIGNNTDSSFSPSILLKNIILPSQFTQASVNTVPIPNLSTKSYPDIDNPSLPTIQQDFSTTVAISQNNVSMQLPQIYSWSAYFVSIQFQSSSPTPTQSAPTLTPIPSLTIFPTSLTPTPTQPLPTPTLTSVPMFGDINGDGKIDILDYNIVSYCYGQTTATVPTCKNADLNNDGIVNGVDYNLFLRAYATAGTQ